MKNLFIIIGFFCFSIVNIVESSPQWLQSADIFRVFNGLSGGGSVKFGRTIPLPTTTLATTITTTTEIPSTSTTTTPTTTITETTTTTSSTSTTTASTPSSTTALITSDTTTPTTTITQSTTASTASTTITPSTTTAATTTPQSTTTETATTTTTTPATTTILVPQQCSSNKEIIVNQINQVTTIFDNDLKTITDAEAEFFGTDSEIQKVLANNIIDPTCANLLTQLTSATAINNQFLKCLAIANVQIVVAKSNILIQLSTKEYDIISCAVSVSFKSILF